MKWTESVRKRGRLGVAALVIGLLQFTFLGRSTGQGAMFLAVGEGQASCGEFLQAVEGERRARMPGDPAETYRTPDYGKYLNFADGFITGANFTDLRWRMLGQSSDHAGRMTWLENYCRKNPLDAYVTALIELRTFLSVKQ
jgi:hypothetical protein